MNDKAAAAMFAARKLMDERRQAEQRAKERRIRSAQRKHAKDPDVKCYRATKRRFAKRSASLTAAIMAEAKAAYDRLNADLEQRGKGGRPKSKGACASIPRSAFRMVNG